MSTDLIKKDISDIDDKRKVLEQIVNITTAIEQMQDSLHSCLVLGLPSKEFPKEALQLYKSLSGSIQHLPVSKVKEYLNNLETVINSQLKKILQLSGMNFSSDETVEILFLSSESEENSIIDLLNDFKRTAQTAVSLRVLLKKRGVSTPGSVMPVSREMIQQQLQHLEEEDKQQRSKIKVQIMEMKESLQVMIENPAYPEAMKSMLTGVMDNLENDLHCIDAGGKLEELSFVTENQELTVPEEQSEEQNQAVQQNEPDSNKQKSSLSKAANRWLNSSWDTSWQDVKNELND